MPSRRAEGRARRKLFAALFVLGLRVSAPPGIKTSVMADYRRALKQPTFATVSFRLVALRLIGSSRTFGVMRHRPRRQASSASLPSSSLPCAPRRYCIGCSLLDARARGNDAADQVRARSTASRTPRSASRYSRPALGVDARPTGCEHVLGLRLIGSRSASARHRVAQ